MNPDVAVVGGGAIGVCVAREIARRGARVVVLERGSRLGCGCSDGNRACFAQVIPRPWPHRWL